MNALVLLPSFFFELGCIFGFWQLNFNQINGHAVAVPGIFGFPQSAAIDELHSKHPFNPYGNSKKIVEDILADMDMDMDMAYGLWLQVCVLSILQCTMPKRTKLQCGGPAVRGKTKCKFHGGLSSGPVT